MEHLQRGDPEACLIPNVQHEHRSSGGSCSDLQLDAPQVSQRPSIQNMAQYQIVNKSEIPDPESAPDSKNPRQKVKKEWIKGLLFCAMGVAFAFAAHLILLLKLAASSASRGYGWASITSTVYEGDCDTANRTATGLHILVNVIVLTLTATSSYCCQVLSAPSRARIDIAHSQRVWVSIGSSSFTNIWYAPYWRKVLWILIWGTSIPVQMIYNSFVYVSIGANDYGIMVGPSNFRNTTDFSDWSLPGDFVKVLGMDLKSLQGEVNSGGFESMNSRDCVDAYSRGYQTDRSTLVVTLNTSASESMIASESFIATLNSTVYAWSCRVDSYNGNVATNGSSGYYSGYDCSPNLVYDGSFHVNMLVAGNDTVVDSCYTQKVSTTCQLGCSLPIGLTVLGCISLKLLCMLVTAMEQRREIILTVGDAIASFLRRTDPYTINNCLMARSNKGQPKSVLAFTNDYPWVSVFSKAVPFRFGQSPPPQPKRLCSTGQKWLNAIPRRLLGFLLILTAAIAIAACFAFALSGRVSGISNKSDAGSSFEQKVSALYQSRISVYDLGFITTVFLVNLPQAVITMIYAIYNNVLTRILLAAEYNSYAAERKPLRVSFPIGEQRATYWLSIPYRYSIPFLGLFTLAHWLCSQAISFIQFVPRNSAGDFLLDRQLNGLALSSLGIKIMMIPVLLGTVGIVILMQRNFKSAAMPLAMNCSAAISAACHPPEGDEHAGEKPVMWGEVDFEVANLGTILGTGLADLETECRHCSFTSKQDVREPDPAIAYY